MSEEKGKTDQLSKIVLTKANKPPIREVGYEKIMHNGDSSGDLPIPFWLRRCTQESKVSESMRQGITCGLPETRLREDKGS